MGPDQIPEQIAPRTDAPPLGRIIAVSGSTATIGILPGTQNPGEDARTTVSKSVVIHSNKSRLIGVITGISLNLPPFAKEQGYRAIAELDLMGEIKLEENGNPQFARGVSEYPAIGDTASLLTSSEFRMIYKQSDGGIASIGRLQQDSSIDAYININELLHKHFAVLGTTGVGKSNAVVILLQQVLATRQDMRVFLLDAHNEYGRCFGDASVILNPRNLKLPFWLFNFEEITDVFFGGRAGIQEEMEILSEVIPLAKSGYLRYRNSPDRSGIKKPELNTSGFTADTPVPYVLADLVNLIDERMGKLENRSSRMIYHKLITRIETVRNDPRYAFMFENANVGGDTFVDVLVQLFRLIPNGKPMTIMQLAGFPAEVVDAVVSVLGRMAFDFGLWSDGAAPLLFVCEEAHRYASADRNIGFGPTRRAVSRIAKEGRKYGVFLGVVTQRPAELDATILSQCSTLFVMRMVNDRDQAIVRSAVSDAAATLLDFVPSLGTREAFALGEGVALPTRMKFKDLERQFRPHNEAVKNLRMEQDEVDLEFISLVVERWRGAMTGNKFRNDSVAFELPLAASSITAPSLTRPTGGLDPERFNILKKPIVARPELSDTARRDLFKK